MSDTKHFCVKWFNKFNKIQKKNVKKENLKLKLKCRRKYFNTQKNRHHTRKKGQQKFVVVEKEKKREKKCKEAKNLNFFQHQQGEEK